MSAYSDWKCGALTDEEYAFCMRRECGGDGPIIIPDIETTSEGDDE